MNDVTSLETIIGRHCWNRRLPARRCDKVVDAPFRRELMHWMCGCGL